MTGEMGRFFATISRMIKASIIPFIGRWGCTFFPCPVKVVAVVGTPLEVPAPIKDPPQEMVDEYHERYVAAVKALYYKHRHRVPGYEKKELYFETDAVPPLPVDIMAAYTQFPTPSGGTHRSRGGRGGSKL